MDLAALAGQHHPVTVFEIADVVGERRQRNRVGAKIHLAVTIADCKRRASAGADHQVVVILEHESQCERAFQARQRLLHSFDRRCALLQIEADEMRNDFGVGLTGELGAALFELEAQFAEILDDAVMHDRDAFGGVRMRVGFGRLAMRRPAGVTDADMTCERRLAELRLRDSSACLRRGGDRYARLPAWQRQRNRSRDIRGASASPRSGQQPDRVPKFRRCRTCGLSLQVVSNCPEILELS